MKKVFLVLGLAALITSCSLNDDDGGQDVKFEYADITNVEFPDTLETGKRFSFEITSEISECSNFYGFDARQQDSTIVLGVLNRILEQTNCGTAIDTVSNDFNSQSGPNSNYEAYVFKFLTGFDATDEPIYLTKTIPVKDR